MKTATIIYLFLLFLVIGCTTSDALVKQRTDLYYQKDIKFKVEVKDAKDKWNTLGEYRGSAVINPADNYKITVFPEGKADLLSVTSCHREERTQDPDKETFKKGYSFEIKPVPAIEEGRACPIEIGVYEQSRGRNGWGFIAVKTDKYKVNALTKCNGQVKTQEGVSVCQSRKDLIQEYTFDRIVEPVATAECSLGDMKPSAKFTFLMPRGSCTVYFIDQKNHNNLHQANLYGYDEILLKE